MLLFNSSRIDIVVLRIDNDTDMLMIFRRGAHHARAADIDVLDDLFERCAARDGCFERIKIDHDKIDGHDTVLFHLGDVFGIVSQSKNSAVDFRMKCFYPAIHHLGKAGDLGNVLYGNLIIAQAARPCRRLRRVRRPIRASARANSTMPFLSETLIRALSILATG